MTDAAPARTPDGAADPPSPCTSVCRMDLEHGWCAGCWRTLDEIAHWGGASGDYKRAVLAQIERRRAMAALVIK